MVFEGMKCPKCNNYLDERDIEDITFRGRIGEHYVYVCKKCRHIIGFSAMHRA